jgi:flagellar biosynthesis GTPase FlhF
VSDLVCKALNAFEYMLELPVISLMGPTAVGKTDLAIDSIVECLI